MSRKVCIKCGRKRAVGKMHSIRYSRLASMWHKKWRGYPNKSSYICDVECLPYKA